MIGQVIILVYTVGKARGPLSPYIFIIAVEILDLVIKQNRKIRGVRWTQKKLKWHNMRMILLWYCLI